MPVEEIVPPVAVHLTLVLDVPVTMAENCCVPPIATEITLGLIETTTDAVPEPGPCEPVPPPQAERPASASRTAKDATERLIFSRLLECSPERAPPKYRKYMWIWLRDDKVFLGV